VDRFVPLPFEGDDVVREGDFLTLFFADDPLVFGVLDAGSFAVPFRADAFLADAFLADAFLAEDFLAEDFLAEDLAEDLAGDFREEDFRPDDFLLDDFFFFFRRSRASAAPP
jgi:hypothetical protein